MYLNLQVKGENSNNKAALEGQIFNAKSLQGAARKKSCWHVTF